jgi:predicted nucleotidyltransferase
MTTAAPVRLTDEEIQILKSAIYKVDPSARIYLFGSRTDLSAQGGDIDLLILSDHFTLQDKRAVRLAFFKYFGEQKLDIVIDSTDSRKIFTKTILPKAVCL